MGFRLATRCLLATELLAITLLATAVGCSQCTATDAGISKPMASNATGTGSAKSNGPTYNDPKTSKTAPATSSSTSPAMDEAARARVANYLKALSEGRRSTQVRNYDGAIAAFGRALEASPGDPRAYAERGYAALLAKSYLNAEDDLRRAAETTRDRKLRAQIFYNLGLVREAGDRDGSSAFALSNFLHSTAAARKKLVGKESCPIESERNPRGELSTYRDWLDFYTKFESAFLNAETNPDSTEAARWLLCGKAGCSGASPWLVSIEGRKSFLVNETEKGLSVAPVASTWLWGGLNFCYPTVDATVVRREQGVLVVRVRVVEGSPEIICDPNGNAHACTEAELEEHQRSPNSQNWVRGCRTSPYTRYKIFDRTAKRWTLQITQYDDINDLLKPSERVRVDVAGDAIELNGPNCHLRIPLSPPTSPSDSQPSSAARHRAPARPNASARLD